MKMPTALFSSMPFSPSLIPDNTIMIHAPRSVEELDLLASDPDIAVIETIGSVEGDVIVAGAGGKMGFHLCLMLRRAFDLLGKQNRVIAVSRFGDEKTRALFESQYLTTHPADLTDADALASLPDAATVFFLAGRKFGTSDSPETLVLYNEVMPALVAERYAGAKIVALSTGCVYPFVEPDSGGSTEEDEVGPVGDYAVSCLGREAAFLRSSEVHRSPLALIRLNYAVDLRYGVLVDLALKVSRGEPVDLTTGYFNCLWQGDAVSRTIRALDHATPAPQPFVLNVTGSRILKVREVALTFERLLNHTVEFTGTEAATAWLSNAGKSRRLFGPPSVSEDRLINWVADWIDHERPLLGKPTHFEVRDGKY
jgi:nucleoside-diphosphate-sugar epimerase